MERKYAIVVVGYNRKKSLARVLRSVCDADYCGDQVDLVISLDYYEDYNMVELAENCTWNFGNKIIKTHTKRLGLKRHILECGTYLNQYDAIAVLEDDIVVAAGFYNYMRQAVAYYETDDNIAGISLYNHPRNVLCGLAFTPAYYGKDTFFFQFAQSWGQIWMRRQWKEFEQWMEKNGSKEITDNSIPAFIRSWPESSWLKYHIQYCINNNKFFVYPYFSFSTCYSDSGENTQKNTTYQQVTMNMGTDRQSFNFANYDAEAVRYDAFFERLGLGKKIGISDNDLCVDIYGMKQNYDSRRFLLSTKQCDYKILKTYGMALRPHENNVIFQEEGAVIYLYDTKQPVRKGAVTPREEERVSYYYINLISNADKLKYALKEIIRNRIRK